MINVGSNAFEVEFNFQIKRWVKGKRRINVTQSAALGHYNSRMGMVDLVARALPNYQPAIHCKN